MKKLILAVAMMAATEAAIAEQPKGSVGVRTNDLIVDGQTKPPAALVNRILDRFYIICGKPVEPALVRSWTADMKRKRAACKATLAVNDTRPVVRAAFNEALAKFR